MNRSIISIGSTNETTSCNALALCGCVPTCFLGATATANNSTCLNGQLASYYSVSTHAHGSLNNGGCLGTATGCIVTTTTSGCLTTTAPSSLTVGTATNATCLNGQLASFYQVASTAINTSNIASQTVSCAGNATSAGNADTVDSLHVHTGRNNEINKIVRTDGSGYIQAGYINSSSGNEANQSSPPRVWGTNGSDDYMRTYCTAWLNVGTAGYAANSSKLYSTDSSYGYYSAAPYYGYLTYDGASLWCFKVSPATPAGVRVQYADSAGSAAYINGMATSTCLCSPVVCAGTKMYAPDFQLTSDIRDKMNIIPIPISPINTEYKQYSLCSTPDRIRYGTVADELRKEHPELVNEDENGRLSVSYIDLLVKEVAYLKYKLAELERRLG